MNTIDVQKLSNADISERLKLAYQLDKEALKQSFSNAGVKLETYQDIEAIARLHETGGDEAGVLRNRYGNKVVFSVESTLNKTKLNYSTPQKVNLDWNKTIKNGIGGVSPDRVL